jgi:hypothetical protein
MSTEIREVVIQIAPGSRQNPYGVCAIGRYKVEDGILTMLDDNDKPLRDRRGPIRRTLEAGEDPVAVAKKLTRDMSMSRRENDFNRPLFYPDVGWR